MLLAPSVDTKGGRLAQTWLDLANRTRSTAKRLQQPSGFHPCSKEVGPTPRTRLPVGAMRGAAASARDHAILQFVSHGLVDTAQGVWLSEFKNAERSDDAIVTACDVAWRCLCSAVCLYLCSITPS